MKNYEPDYTYGGQWFDDMGSLALSFQNTPALGIELARSNLTRRAINDLASKLLKTEPAPYDEGMNQGV